MELRGEVELKGKGVVTAYWLIGCTEPDPRFVSLILFEEFSAQLSSNFPFRPPTPLKSHHIENEAPFPILFPAIGK